MTDQRPDQPPQPDDAQREAMRAARARIDRVNDWLHLGAAMPSSDYERLRAAGITHVIDLREESDADAASLQALGIIGRHVPVPDNGPPTTGQLVEVASLIGENDQSVSMYVHCKGGFGRAATMAVGLLVVQGVALDDAVAQVRTARPEMRLNADQLAWLRVVEQEFVAAQSRR